jgi:acyl-CoA synthetase (AMP-forming)/AMP-acid ligase II
MLLGDILAGNARRIPNRRAWRFNSSMWTWAEANGRTNRLASSLLRQGIRFQDRVALISNNSNQYLEIIFALAKIGAVAVPINSRASAREVDFILSDVDARTLIISSEHSPILTALQADKKLLTLIGMGQGHALETDIEQMIAGGEADEHRADFSDEAIRTIKYTSGTTGDPKGCIGTHRTMMFSVQNYLSNAPAIAAADLGMMFVPLASGFGLNTLVDFAYREAETLLVDKFNADKILSLIESEKVVRTCAVPTMITALAEEQIRRPRDLSSLKMIGYTGSSMAVTALTTAAKSLGCDFYQGYGSTESGSRVTYLSPEEHRVLSDKMSTQDKWGQQIVSCGRELPGYEVRIVDEGGQIVPNGEVGELVVRGDSVFSGYWAQPEKTRDAIKDGWLYSGDLARKDDRGYFYIVDRKRDMIVSGGYNVYSIEVETAILEMAGVSEVAVIGRFDERWGEAIHAVIVPKEEKSISEIDVIQHCKGLLANYKCPKSVTFEAALPKTSTGKVQKSKLKLSLSDDSNREGARA